MKIIIQKNNNEFLVMRFAIFVSNTEQNKCHPNPCRNGGTCTGINEGEGFECTCREGYKGKNCEGMLRIMLKYL